MKPTVWHVMIAILLIAYFFGAAALIAYVLYGPGFEIKVPDFFGSRSATTTTESTGEDRAAPAVDLLAGYRGTLYECEGDKALKAEFLEEKVNLVLSDGRQVSLPEIISEVGMRYANTDESFVFLSKENGASVEESTAITYANCLASD